MGNIEAVWCDYCSSDITAGWHTMETGEKFCSPCFNGETTNPNLEPLSPSAMCENCKLGCPASELVDGICPDCLEFLI